MKNQAFTLIELLVVILIIGILAAIAVPQYQKAVLKSRYHTLMNMAKAVKDAQEVYFLANGKYSEHFSELDIAAPNIDSIGHFTGLNNGTESVNNLANYEAMFFNNGEGVVILFTNQVISILLKNGNRYMDYNLKLDNEVISSWGTSRALCAAWNTDIGEKVCKDLSNYKDSCGINGSRYICYLY